MGDRLGIPGAVCSFRERERERERERQTDRDREREREIQRERQRERDRERERERERGLYAGTNTRKSHATRYVNKHTGLARPRTTAWSSV